MCIIAVKEAGAEWPTWNTLAQCWNRNPDGAGIMYNDARGNVVIEKGFMDWIEFKRKIKQVKRLCEANTTVVMHFRIKTHGEVSRECCHPFPLEGKLDILRQTEVTTHIGVAHNGIITGRDTNAKKSDTMDFIMEVLYPIYNLCPDFMENKYAENLIFDGLGTCRLAILDGDGYCRLYGTWYEENGMHYSNTSYKETRMVAKKQTAYVGYGNWYNKHDDDLWGDQVDDAKPYGEIVRSGGKPDAWVFDAKTGTWGFESEFKWMEDYQGIESVKQADFMKKQPSPVCTSCPQFQDCIADLVWSCLDEDEADDTVALIFADTVKRDIDKNSVKFVDHDDKK